MPSRILREGILTSRAVNSLSEPAQLFYRCLMSIVDDFGRFEADADLLRARLFPLALDRWPIARVEQMLEEISTCAATDGFPLVLVYEVNGRKYLEINNFNQKTRSKPRYPNPSARHVVDARRAIAVQVPADVPRLRTYSESESESYSESGTNIPPKLPLAVKANGTASFDPMPGWNKFKLTYPSHRINEFTDLGVWIGIVDSAEIQGAIMKSLMAFKASVEWENPRFVPQAAKWLGERRFATVPCPAEENSKEIHYGDL